VSGDEDDAEQRTGLGSDPEGVDFGFSDAATESGDAASGCPASSRIARGRQPSWR
jgi:hypothetical protein